MKKAYTIFAALSDEANEGWVWFGCPSLPARTIVKVHCPRTHRTVYCESRRIDPNFKCKYNETPRQYIQNPCESLVIGEWYRNALGGIATKQVVELDITPARVPAWSGIRASCQHPQIVVRVGTRLGALGAWLGLVGFAAALLDHNSDCGILSLIAVALVGAVVGGLACSGTQPPTS